MRRHLALLLVVGSGAVFLPAAAPAMRTPAIVPFARLLCGCHLAAAAEVSASVTQGATSLGMSIVHVFRGCHAWAIGAKRLGPAPRISAKPGTRLKIRVSCPMDFDVVQTSGPKLALGSPRFISGTTRSIVFRKAGVYRLVARNVRSSQDVGLQTLGDDNMLRLTVRVR